MNLRHASCSSVKKKEALSFLTSGRWLDPHLIRKQSYNTRLLLLVLAGGDVGSTIVCVSDVLLVLLQLSVIQEMSANYTMSFTVEKKA